ncbi:DUF1533 domain-containing protein [Clostridium sp. SHJSY1]|uniref:hemoblobin-interacting domain-containing protein n=1 Tax=Clostridium sp. SHJSY1 TaxID=2942483 RepID=UPI0028765885|nr:hemoblobin-interacting domain-containing protein [Clostridium sp. SHJSY1]MDS0526665.1 DUF1533 domain-containing protein [Clostridium sp. SHJSY1]
MKGKKIYLIIATILCISSNTALAAPYEVFTKTSLEAWDYYNTQYDENGKIRYFPQKTTFSINNNSNTTDSNYMKVVKVNFGSNAELSYDNNNDNYSKWVAAISKITVVKLDGLPMMGEEIGYEKKAGKLILKTEKIEGNGIYKVKISADGYNDINLNIDIIKPAPKLLIKGDSYPIKLNSKNYFEIDTNAFSYVFNNPIYDVLLDGQSLNKDEYSIINYLITLNDRAIKDAGQHELVVKMYGYEDSSIKFIAEDENGQAVNKLSSIAKKVSNIYKKSPTNFNEVDVISSATKTNAATVPAFLVFRFDEIANAIILKDQGLETAESKETLAWWNSVRKESLRDENSKVLYDWNDFVNKVSESLVNGKILSFENYVKDGGKTHYVDTFEVKYVLEDGKLGEPFDLGELLSNSAPTPKVIYSDWKKGVKINFEANANWTNSITNIEVNGTELYKNEYSLTNESIDFKNISQRFSSGDNEITIIASGYKTVKVKVNMNKTLNLSLEKTKYYIGNDVVIKGLPKDFSGINVKLNGENVSEFSQTGQSNTYKVDNGKIILNKSLFKEVGAKSIFINIYGYNEVRIDFEVSKI